MQATLNSVPAAAQRPAPPPAPPPPAGARPYDRGPHDVAVLACVAALTEALRPHHGALDFARWLMPAGEAWGAVTGHYQAELPAGWTPERLPERQQGCQVRAWSGNGQLLAVALTDAFEAPQPFKVLIVATRAAG